MDQYWDGNPQITVWLTQAEKDHMDAHGGRKLLRYLINAEYQKRVREVTELVRTYGAGATVKVNIRIHYAVKEWLSLRGGSTFVKELLHRHMAKEEKGGQVPNLAQA